jgi:hypothetical protein
MAGITSGGGAAARRQGVRKRAAARRPGQPQRARGFASPWWPRADVQTAVKIAGAVMRTEAALVEVAAWYGGARQRKQGRRGSWLRGVLGSHVQSSGFARSPASWRWAWGSPSPLLLLLLLRRAVAVRSGEDSPWRLGLWLAEARRRPSYSAWRDAGRVDGADHSGGHGRLAASGAALSSGDVAKSKRGKAKGRMTGGRRLTPGRRHLGPTRRRPGAVVVGGRRAGVSWAAAGWKGKKWGCRGVREEKTEVAQQTSRAWACGPREIPLSPFLFLPKPFLNWIQI